MCWLRYIGLRLLFFAEVADGEFSLPLTPPRWASDKLMIPFISRQILT